MKNEDMVHIKGYFKLLYKCELIIESVSYLQQAGGSDGGISNSSSKGGGGALGVVALAIVVVVLVVVNTKLIIFLDFVVHDVSIVIN